MIRRVMLSVICVAAGPVFFVSGCASGARRADGSLVTLQDVSRPAPSDQNSGAARLHRTKWSADGPMKAVSRYDESGRPHGYWEFYNRQGDSVLGLVFSHGQLTGIWTPDVNGER